MGVGGAIFWGLPVQGCEWVLLCRGKGEHCFHMVRPDSEQVGAGEGCLLKEGLLLFL